MVVREVARGPLVLVDFVSADVKTVRFVSEARGVLRFAKAVMPHGALTEPTERGLIRTAGSTHRTGEHVAMAASARS